MRIALVAPLVAPITADGVPLGGAQSFLVDLAQGLAGRGHAVTLLGADGSRLAGVRTPGLGIYADRLRPAVFGPNGSERARDDLELQQDGFARVRAWLDRYRDAFDLVHAHAFDGPAFDVLVGLGRPVAHTLHLPPVDPSVVAAAERAAAAGALLVTVTEACAGLWRAAGVPIAAVVPNGLAVERVPFRECSDGYLLFAGRLSPEKGADLAIRLAAAVGLPLVIVGGRYDDDYYRREVAPWVREVPGWRPGEPLEPGATYLGSRQRDELFEIMASADGLLAPVRWDEPFGLVALEAQAAGCPVVASARGGLVEVIAPGRSGFLVPAGDERAILAALGRLGEIDRAACRAWAAERFGIDRMLAGYERIYARMSEAV